MNNRDILQVVKLGVFLYDDTIICDIRIVRRDYGVTEEDMLNDSDGSIGEFYFIEFGSPLERGKYVSGSMAKKSLEEACREAEKATHCTISWND